MYTVCTTSTTFLSSISAAAATEGKGEREIATQLLLLSVYVTTTACELDTAVLYSVIARYY